MATEENVPTYSSAQPTAPFIHFTLNSPVWEAGELTTLLEQISMYIYYKSLWKQSTSFAAAVVCISLQEHLTATWKRNVNGCFVAVWGVFNCSFWGPAQARSFPAQV